jgi:hypothetical protein
VELIRNKTTKSLRVPLPNGKVLHLGPCQEGQISAHAVDHGPLVRLIEIGDIELAGSSALHSEREARVHVHDDTHGHHSQTTIKNRGDR